jgi:hypothetical protein
VKEEQDEERDKANEMKKPRIVESVKMTKTTGRKWEALKKSRRR